MFLPELPEVFALLDDSLAPASEGVSSSRLYTGYVCTHVCHDPATLAACWALARQDLASGLHAVVLADYEWGARLQGAGRSVGDGTALRLMMFRQLQLLDDDGVLAFLRRLDADAESPTAAGVLELEPDVSEAAFLEAIVAIQEAIRRGEFYQVNYTYRLEGRAWGSPSALYRRLRARQRVGFGAFVALPLDESPAATTHVLSCSPELFLRHENGWVTARPMKGTAARAAEAEHDHAAAAALQHDEKNRAENLMIVDLLRNDLGRIAEIGSVQVPSLFSIESYATVFQMTSTVRARVRPEIDFAALLCATFPCGSITGAPKLAAMDRIRCLERQPRGLYCGAIGWLNAPTQSADGAALGDFCLSVAIRTLTLSAPANDGTRRLRGGVGAGIVLDSVAEDEAAECRLKARFLTDVDPGVGLFETMRIEARPKPAALQLERHLARLECSARALGFSFNLEAARAALEVALAKLFGEGPWRLRLDLAHDGRLVATSSALPALEANHRGLVRLAWADAVLPARDALAAHKTTRRAHYDAAVRAAESDGCFDQIFVNAAGRVVEGGRSSLFVRRDRTWYTPPIEDGALPGLCRATALAHGIAGLPVVERSLCVTDVVQAHAWAVGNALRGVVPATLEQRRTQPTRLR